MLLIHWLAALLAIAFSDTRGAMGRGASCAGPGERAPAVARDALARDRVHDRTGRTSDGRTCEKSRLFEHDVRGVASQVVGALKQIARNPGSLDRAARRGNREGGEGTARGVESGGRLGGPFLEVLGSFGGKSSGGHLSSFCLGASGFFSERRGAAVSHCAPMAIRIHGNQFKKKNLTRLSFHSWQYTPQPPHGCERVGRWAQQYTVSHRHEPLRW
jgi:hypothetical protein